VKTPSKKAVAMAEVVVYNRQCKSGVFEFWAQCGASERGIEFGGQNGI